MGEPTFGKGTVQNLLDLDRFFPKSDLKFGQLKITLAKYYRVSGGSTQKIGVEPHVFFPNIYDRDIYTENARKNALEWDKIRDVSYYDNKYISEPLVKHLNTKFSNDSKSDSSIINYLSFVKRTQENRKKNSISLNYETRLEEKKSNESDANSLNTSIKITEIFPIEQEDLMKKIKNDLYLRESVKLFVEMIDFKTT